MRMYELVSELENISGDGRMMHNVYFVTPDGIRYGIRDVLYSTNEVLLMAVEKKNVAEE